jgi:hypothetical protein
MSATMKNAIEAHRAPRGYGGGVPAGAELRSRPRIRRAPVSRRRPSRRIRAGRARPFTRCLRCNLPLERVEKAAVADRLPENVRQTQEDFTHCAGCDRVYWTGSHWDRMRRLLRAVLTGPCAPVDDAERRNL